MENHWRFGCPPKKWGWSEQKWRWFYGYYVLIFAGSLSQWLVVKCYRTKSRRQYNRIRRCCSNTCVISSWERINHSQVWRTWKTRSACQSFAWFSWRVHLFFRRWCSFLWQSLQFHQSKLRSCAAAHALRLIMYVLLIFFQLVTHTHLFEGEDDTDGVMGFLHEDPMWSSQCHDINQVRGLWNGFVWK